MATVQPLWTIECSLSSDFYRVGWEGDGYMRANQVSDTHSNNAPPGSSQSQRRNEQPCKACLTSDDNRYLVDMMMMMVLYLLHLVFDYLYSMGSPEKLI